MGYRNSDTIAIFEAYGQVSKQDRFEKYKENIMKDPNMSSAEKQKAIAKLEKALLGTDNSTTTTPVASNEPDTAPTTAEPSTPVASDDSQTYQFNPNAPKKPIQYNDDGTMRIGPEIQDDEFETDEFEDGDDEDWDTTTITHTHPDGSTEIIRKDNNPDMGINAGDSEGEWAQVQGSPYLYNTKTGEIRTDQRRDRDEWVHVPGTMELRNRRTGESRPIGSPHGSSYKRTITTTVPASDEEMGIER